MKKLITALLFFSLLSCKEKNYQPFVTTVVSENGADIIIPEEKTPEQEHIADNQDQPQKQNTDGASDFDNTDAYVKNETCAKISQLYTQAIVGEQVFGRYNRGDLSEEDIEYYKKKYGITKENWEDAYKKLDLVPKLLTDFLKTKESWSIDIEKDLDFLKGFDVSDDGMVRIYTWDNWEGGTGDSNQNIIQYRTKTGAVNAVYSRDLFDIGFGYGLEYWVGRKLKEDVYLLGGGGRAGGFYANGSYVAVKLTDKKILPYKAFNGESDLSFNYLVGDKNGGIADFEDNFDQNETPFQIKIIYDVFRKKDLLFTFNGSEFIGDYEKFYELTQM